MVGCGDRAFSLPRCFRQRELLGSGSRIGGTPFSLSLPLSLHHCFNVNDLIPGYRIRRRFQGGTEGGLIYRIAKIGRNKFFFPMFPYDWRGG